MFAFLFLVYRNAWYVYIAMFISMVFMSVLERYLSATSHITASIGKGAMGWSGQAVTYSFLLGLHYLRGIAINLIIMVCSCLNDPTLSGIKPA